MRDNAIGAGNQQGRPAVLVREPSETTRRVPHMTRELAILLGLLYTDGCVSPKGKSSWRIYFAVRSLHLVEVFRECITTSFVLEAHRVRIGRTRDGLTKAVVDAKEVGTWLTSTFGTFRTLRFDGGALPSTRLPVTALLRSGYTAEFLRAAFSCDGGVSLYPARRDGARGGTCWLIRTVFLACAHPRLRSEYRSLLGSLGIRAREVPNDQKLKIETERDIRRFARRIGFIPGVQVTDHSKFWSGVAKSRVLDLVLESYGAPATIYNLPRFMMR